MFSGTHARLTLGTVAYQATLERPFTPKGQHFFGRKEASLREKRRAKVERLQRELAHEQV